MSGIRYERFSRMMSPSSPRPCGRSPIRARSSSLMPLVMKRSIAPWASTMPMAAYCAWTRSRTRSAMSCSTRSRSSTPLMPRTAWSSALSWFVARSAWARTRAARNPRSSACAMAVACSGSPLIRADPIGPASPGTLSAISAPSVPPPRSRSRSASGGAWTWTRPTVRPISPATLCHRVLDGELTLGRRLRLPGVDRLEQWRQDEVTRGGRRAGRGDRSGCSIGAKASVCQAENSHARTHDRPMRPGSGRTSDR